MQFRARQFAEGMIVSSDLLTGRLIAGQRESLLVTLRQGRCYRIIGVDDARVADLDMRLFDGAGVLIDMDLYVDNYPVLGLTRRLCPNRTALHQVQVHMDSGAGAYAVQVFSLPAHVSMPVPRL